MTSSIIRSPLSNNTDMAVALSNIERTLDIAARANVDAVADGYTEEEKHSMVKVEALRLINDLDLAAILLRGKILKEIEDNALWSTHPGHYDTLESMARDQGIATSQLSQVRDLCYVIFPYFEETLGIPIPQLWGQIGKSNFLELLPVLKSIITGEPSNKDSVNGAVDRILEDVAATARSSGQDLDEAGLRRAALGVLMQDGQSMTNADLRQRLRPDRTPSLEPVIVDGSGNQYMVMQLSADQETMVNRLLHGHMDPIRVSASEARRHVAMREFLRLIGG